MNTETTTQLIATRADIGAGKFDWCSRPIDEPLRLFNHLRSTKAHWCWGMHRPVYMKHALRFTASNNDLLDIGFRERTWIYITVSGKDLFVLTLVPKNGKRILRQVDDIHLDALLDTIDEVLEHRG